MIKRKCAICTRYFRVDEADFEEHLRIEHNTMGQALPEEYYVCSECMHEIFKLFYW